MLQRKAQFLFCVKSARYEIIPIKKHKLHVRPRPRDTLYGNVMVMCVCMCGVRDSNIINDFSSSEEDTYDQRRLFFRENEFPVKFIREKYLIISPPSSVSGCDFHRTKTVDCN